MPVINVFVPAERVPAPRQGEFGPAVIQACVDWLGADPVKVQCNVTPSQVVTGAPSYVEVLYRAAESRDATAMAGFMQALDTAVQTTFGCSPRIRCMAIEPATLWARH
ncbi:hypothetical protein IMZ29_16895 [Achromobacter sp. GG226]|uniref:hypothetical protein n=1 Tax=Verticiella alkaliphila TaxID=2779529 RepID=UPI001C0ACA33|nr:hypothetical protein [Verticiella sp. GG226]MBU4612156.1 hypothetical protein [Verticiella sp. GG226]